MLKFKITPMVAIVAGVSLLLGAGVSYLIFRRKPEGEVEQLSKGESQLIQLPKPDVIKLGDKAKSVENLKRFIYGIQTELGVPENARLTKDGAYDTETKGMVTDLFTGTLALKEGNDGALEVTFVSDLLKTIDNIGTYKKKVNAVNAEPKQEPEDINAVEIDSKPLNSSPSSKPEENIEPESDSNGQETKAGISDEIRKSLYQLGWSKAKVNLMPPEKAKELIENKTRPVSAKRQDKNKDSENNDSQK